MALFSLSLDLLHIDEMFPDPIGIDPISFGPALLTAPVEAKPAVEGPAIDFWRFCVHQDFGFFVSPSGQGHSINHLACSWPLF